MKIKKELIRFWKFLQEDSWLSWIVSIILIIVLVKGIFFPILTLITGTPLPLVVVESCSMYHDFNFEEWWEAHGKWYEKHNISKAEFSNNAFENGLNKGDIILVWGKKSYQKGDIIIFNANAKHPLIHRIINSNPYGTKGDNNAEQLKKDNNLNQIDETNISQNQILGKAIGKIPLLGWVKLIFFEPFRQPEQKGLCKDSNPNI